MAGEEGGFPTPPAPTTPGTMAGGGSGDEAMISQLIQMLTGGGGMGGMASPQGNLGGGSQMLPPGGIPITPDALGMGAGGDPLGMGAALMGGGIGLNPAQAAGIRLRGRNEMNALRQRMANQHRAIGPAGGRDYSRHVQNIDDEMMALQESKIQDNIKNALAYDQMLMQYGQQNSARNTAMSKALQQALADIFRYGGAEQPGTFAPAEGG